MIYNDNRPERIRGIVYLMSVCLVVAYEAVNMFVPNADAIVALRICSAAVYSAVLYAYFGVAMRGFFSPNPQREDFLLTGIWLSFLSHNLHTIYATVYRLADAPKWLLNAEVVPFIVMISMVAGALHLIPTKDGNDAIPPRDRIVFSAIIGVCVLLIGVVVATRPDIRPAVDWFRPYLGDFWHTGSVLSPNVLPA